MSKLEKSMSRLLSKPIDFSWQELVTLMNALGFELRTTGGSGRKFIRPETGATLFIHEPHPASILKAYGYNGSVEYSAEDRILHGSLLGIRDMVTYEGSDVDSLEANFKAAIDEYLAFCEAEGKTPDRPFKGSFNVRVGADLHKRAVLFAEEHNQKLNNIVSQALETFLAVEEAHR
jgi:predicted HicB family RNase H-like nuclease